MVPALSRAATILCVAARSRRRIVDIHSFRCTNRHTDITREVRVYRIDDRGRGPAALLPVQL